MLAKELIEKKRDGKRLDRVEIEFLVKGYCEELIPDYQMAAFLMAVQFQGLSSKETEYLTKAMLDSGETVPLEGLGETVDKHSTGGVGDKTTLIVAPLVASLGVTVPKLSGRGLAHTGGTLDKLESISGVRIDLSLEEFLKVAKDVGVVVASPTGEIVPADRKIYALRDATGTVRNLGLIVASIMSKKLAVETKGIVLDVKVGEGAFFKTEKEAREFAKEAIKVGKKFGRQVRCVLTEMERPLGRSVGNAMEVSEALGVLRGEVKGGLLEVCLTVATQMVLAARGGEEKTVRQELEEAISSGKALAKFQEWIEAQGGRKGALARLPKSPMEMVTATKDGIIQGIHSLAIGEAAMKCGAGRASKEDKIDPGAGIFLLKEVGDRVEEGEEIAIFCTKRKRAVSEVRESIVAAFEIGKQKVLKRSPIIGVLAK